MLCLEEKKKKLFLKCQFQKQTYKYCLSSLIPVITRSCSDMTRYKDQSCNNILYNVHYMYRLSNCKSQFIEVKTERGCYKGPSPFLLSKGKKYLQGLLSIQTIISVIFTRVQAQIWYKVLSVLSIILLQTHVVAFVEK